MFVHLILIRFPIECIHEGFSRKSTRLQNAYYRSRLLRSSEGNSNCCCFLLTSCFWKTSVLPAHIINRWSHVWRGNQWEKFAESTQATVLGCHSMENCELARGHHGNFLRYSSVPIWCALFFDLVIKAHNKISRFFSLRREQSWFLDGHEAAISERLCTVRWFVLHKIIVVSFREAQNLPIDVMSSFFNGWTLQSQTHMLFL